MDKEIFNGNLGFWDYVTIAFYTRFAPKKLAAIGPVRAVAYALPNGKTFFSSSPRLQELKPLPTSAPLPMPRAMAMSVIEEYALPNFLNAANTSASPELDNEFEASIQKRDAEELAESYRASNPACTDIDFQKSAEAVIIARDGVDHFHTNEEK